MNFYTTFLISSFIAANIIFLNVEIIQVHISAIPEEPVAGVGNSS